DQHCRLGTGITIHLINGFGNSFRNSGAQRIHGRVVDGNDGDIVIFTEVHQVAHKNVSIAKNESAGVHCMANASLLVPAQCSDRNLRTALCAASVWSVAKMWLACDSRTNSAPGMREAISLPLSGGTNWSDSP